MRCSLLTLSCYLDDELDISRRGEMEAHLVGCPRCRSGLGHLREEVERVGGLARVRVPERSARAMLELLGLIGPGEPLPPRVESMPDAPVSELPWLGAGVGAALPWAAPPRTQRPSSPPAAAGSPGLVAVLTPPPAAPGRTAEQDAAREEADLDLVLPAAEVTGNAAAEAPADDEPELPIFDAPAAGEAPGAGPSADTIPAPSAAPGDAAPQPLPVTSVPPPPSARRIPDEPAALLVDPERRERIVSGLVGTDQPHPPGAAPWWSAQAEPPGDEPAPVAETPAAAMAATPAPPDTATPSPPPHVAPHAPAAPPGEPLVAVSLPDRPEALYPLTDDDVPDEPFSTEPPTEGPMPAPRAGLFERFREKLAMRRAISSDLDAGLEDGVEVISGVGAPLRRGSARADLARRRSEALRPAGLDAPVWPGPARETGVREMLPPSAHPSQLPRPANPTLFGTPVDRLSGRALPASPLGKPLDDQAGVHVLHHVPAAAPPPSAPSERGSVIPPLHEDGFDGDFPAPPRRSRAEPATTRRAPSPSELHEGRRLVAVYVAAVLVLFVIGIVSSRTTTPIPTATGSSSSSSSSTSTQGSTGGQSSVPAGQPSAGAPQASSAPSAQPAPAQPTAPQTVGSGGTGWQIQQFRFGDHTTFYRIVIDMSGTATAAPTVMVANQDAQTILLTLAGTQAAAAPVVPPAGATVTKVSLVTPSTVPGGVTYRISLAKPGTGHPSVLSGPVRIVIDIS